MKFSVLLSYCESAETHHGLSGHERRLVYQLAIETGLRWGEIHALSRLDFCFSSANYVRISAANSKNGKTDKIPLRDELSTLIERYFARNPALPQAKAFPGMWLRKGGEMLSEDLVASGITLRMSLGRFLISTVSDTLAEPDWQEVECFRRLPCA